MKLKFSVLGEPAGKGRPRFRNAGAFVQTYTPEKTVNYENLVTLEYRRQCRDFKFPKDTPLDVRITAYYGIPKSVSKKKAQLMRERKIRPMKKPDFDNIGKIVCDSLNDIAYGGSYDNSYQQPSGDFSEIPDDDAGELPF